MHNPKLRQQRERAGLSQRDLQAATGIAQPTISAIENGNAKMFPGYARRLATALGVSVDAIV